MLKASFFFSNQIKGMLEVKGVLMMANFSFYVATYLLPLFTICKYICTAILFYGCKISYCACGTPAFSTLAKVEMEKNCPVVNVIFFTFDTKCF